MTAAVPPSVGSPAWVLLVRAGANPARAAAGSAQAAARDLGVGLDASLAPGLPVAAPLAGVAEPAPGSAAWIVMVRARGAPPVFSAELPAALTRCEPTVGSAEWVARVRARAPPVAPRGGATLAGRKRSAPGVHPAFRLPDWLTNDEAYSGVTHAAALLLIEAMRTVKDTRDSNLSLANAGALEAYARLSGAEKVATLTEARITLAAGSDRRVQARKRYITAMRINFPRMLIFPVTLEAILVYSSDHVLLHGNKSHGVGDMISELRCACRALGEWGLTVDDEFFLLANSRFLKRAFPSETALPPSLTLAQLEQLYLYLERANTLCSRLCLALVTLMVLAQARATELCDGHLWRGDVHFHAYGVLIAGVLNKMRHNTLDALARVAPALPTFLRAHDASGPLRRHLFIDAGWGTHAVTARTPVFREPECGADGVWRLSDRPLSSSSARSMITKYLAAAGVQSVVDPFSLHFGRAAGFNLLHNTLMLDKPLCAAAGGWRTHDVIDKHYHKQSPLELAVRIHYDLLRRAELTKWELG